MLSVVLAIQFGLLQNNDTMEVIKIIKIVSSSIEIKDDASGSVLAGKFYQMEIADKDGHTRCVNLLFDNDGKGICANDYRNKVQFRFRDVSKGVEHCEEGEAIEVEVSKFLGDSYSASLLLNA